MAGRWSYWAGGACAAALGLGSWLAWEDARRGPDESLDADAFKVEAVQPALARPAPAAAESPDRQARRRSSQQHYLSGVIYLQRGDEAKAREEWALAVRLDAGNAEARAGLAKLDAEDARR